MEKHQNIKQSENRNYFSSIQSAGL